MKRRLALAGLVGLGAAPWLLTAFAPPPVGSPRDEVGGPPPGAWSARARAVPDGAETLEQQPDALLRGREEVKP